MQHQQNATRLAPAIKVAGGAAAFLVHLVVIGMVFYSPSVQLPQGSEDAAEVFFVELSDMISEDIQQAADQPDADSTIQPESAPNNEPEPEPEPLIEPEPEPLIEPEPEPVIEPEPEPVIEPVIEPEPEPIPPPEPVIESEPKPEPVIQPEPEHVPPPPKPQPKPKPKPAAKPVVSVKPQSAPVKSSTSEGQDAKTSAPVATAPPSDEPRLVSAVDYLGKRPMPVYPRLSQRRKEQGRVLVRVLISPQGTVMNVAIRSSSGFDQLDQAALKAARTARFKPYTENGVAYRAMADLPFDFVL